MEKQSIDISRRGFLTGALAWTASMMAPAARAVVSAAEDAAKPLPAYYNDYLEQVAAKVNALAPEAADGFWFITDLHITANRRQSGKALARLTAKVPSLKKTFCGGDLPEAFSSRFESSKAGVDYAIDYYRLFWVEPIEASGQLVYTAKGNHDFTIRYDANTNDGFTYDGLAARKVVMGSKGCKGADVVTNLDDPTACYYYFDNKTARIRYIFIDTTDTINPKSKFWGVVYGMHETQIKWLADNAVSTIPDNYDVVVVNHIPLTACVGGEGDRKMFAPFRNLIEAYQNRQTYALYGKTYDFTKATGRILMEICGHEHAERQTYQNGILHVTEPCDAAYSDYIIGSQPWCGDLPRKQGGTVNEQTFDAVQLDTKNRLVYFTRVGGGQDRVIHAQALTAKVGQPFSVKATHLKGPLTWGCYDSARIVFKKNPKSRYCPLVSYTNELATIGADGQLTAIKPGEIMILAMDAKRNKEIFPVVIQQ